MVLRWNTILVSVLLVCQIVLGAPNIRRAKRDDSNAVAAENSDLNPITYEDGAIDGLDREKRKLPEATFQAKNAILGFVFGASRNVAGASLGGQSRSSVTTTQPTITTTDDTPDFNRDKVQLDISDKLFASGIPLIMSVSQTIGDFVLRTARRSAEFVWLLQPIIGKNLKVEIPTTTPRQAE